MKKHWIKLRGIGELWTACGINRYAIDSKQETYKPKEATCKNCKRAARRK